MTHVIILSGISGSGKSTLARQLVQEHGDAYRICSADSYFEDADGYHFDAAQLSNAHAHCFREYVDALQSSATYDGDVLVIVSNTNLAIDEISPYVLGANAYGIPFEIRTIICDPAKAAARNVHGLDLAKVNKQYEKLQHRRLPKYWKNVEVQSG